MNKAKTLNLIPIIKGEKISNIAPDLVVIACCLLSLGLSIIESRLNFDTHHWGLMYGNAADLNKGLIPYKEIFIQYGFLTTWIQAVSLNFLGDTIVSVGVITGFFYSVNIYLSYCLWQKILNKWLSALSALIMFLMHGYITYPWSNYISYTFLLLSLLFLVNSQQRKSYYLLSGVCFALNVLARQTVLVSTLVSIEIYFVWNYFTYENNIRKNFLINIAIFHLSIVAIWGSFCLYIIKIDADTDWYLQSVTIFEFYRQFMGGKLKILKSLIKSLIFARNYANITDIRTLLYSLVFFNTLILWGLLLIGLFSHHKMIKNRDQSACLFLFSTMVLLGYIQSLHYYEIFRLQSSSSLGLGLIIFCLAKLLVHYGLGKWNKLVWLMPLVCLIVLLSQTLLFTRTSSVPTPWNKDQLFSGQLQEPVKVNILRGKLYTHEVIHYFTTLKETLEKYSNQLDYLVNYSSDSSVLYLSNQFNYVQRAPFYDTQMFTLIFSDEKTVINQLFSDEKTIFVTQYHDKIPENYCEVFNIEIPKIINFPSGLIYVAVPKAISKDCKTVE